MNCRLAIIEWYKKNTPPATACCAMAVAQRNTLLTSHSSTLYSSTSRITLVTRHTSRAGYTRLTLAAGAARLLPYPATRGAWAAAWA